MRPSLSGADNASPSCPGKMNSMTNLRRCCLLASFSVFVLLLQGSPVRAQGKAPSARPFEVDFDKCFDHQGDFPYLFTFAGTASGDVSGTLEARVAVFIPNVQPNQVHLQADYVVTGTLAFTARVGGRADGTTNLAVLRGFVSEGPAWLIGAGVHDEFENYVRSDGTACSRGTLYITPRWKQSHNEDSE
jgi:hypothetical protein